MVVRGEENLVRSSWWVSILMSCLVSLLLLLAIESGLRIFSAESNLDPLSLIAWQARLYSAGVNRAKSDSLVTNPSGLLVAHPLTPFTNAEGYRTPPFEEPAGGRKTVMFLGDSFTWGLSAEPETSAFPDIVRQEGYRVVNLGIPATGPTQYLAQAREYIGAVHPDAVCVVFFTGNDFIPEAPIAPGRRRYYETDVGLIAASKLDGTPLSYEDAIRQRSAEAPPWLTPWVASVIAKSAMGRFAASFAQPPTGLEQNVPRVRQQLAEIATICEQQAVKFFLLLIPPRPEMRSNLTSLEFASEALGDLINTTVPELLDNDYAPLPDIHLNNSGHVKYGKHVLTLLRDTGFAPNSYDEADTLATVRPVTLEELKAYLQLPADSAPLLLRHLNLLKMKLSTLYSRGPVNSTTGAPISLVQMTGTDIPDPLAAPHIAALVPFGYENTYAEVRGTIELEAYRGLAAELPPSALQRFKRIPMEHLRSIETGFDPVKDDVKARAGAGN